MKKLKKKKKMLVWSGCWGEEHIIAGNEKNKKKMIEDKRRENDQAKEDGEKDPQDLRQPPQQSDYQCRSLTQLLKNTLLKNSMS